MYPEKQLLRLLGATGRLATTPEECIEAGEVIFAKRPFLCGRDCTCPRDATEAEMPLDPWTGKWGRLPQDENGLRVLCRECGKVDVDGSHSPGAV